MLDIRKISRGFQVTLPRSFREKYNLHIGDRIEAIERGDELIIRPLKMSRHERVNELLNFLEKKCPNNFENMPEDELLKLITEEVKKIRKEKKK